MILKAKVLMLPNYNFSCLSFSHQVTECQCDGALFNWILFSASLLTALYLLCLLHFSESPGNQPFVISQRVQVHFSLFPQVRDHTPWQLGAPSPRPPRSFFFLSPFKHVKVRQRVKKGQRLNDEDEDSLTWNL